MASNLSGRSGARQRGVNDRPVAGAAAEIARELIVDPVTIDGAALLAHGEERHDDAGRAEAALRAVVIDHRLLNGVKRGPVRQIFDGQDLGAVRHAQEGDAGIDRPVHKLAVLQSRENDGAGAAIAFIAAFLRSRGAAILPQPVKKAPCRRKVSQPKALVSEDDADVVAQSRLFHYA